MANEYWIPACAGMTPVVRTWTKPRSLSYRRKPVSRTPSAVPAALDSGVRRNAELGLTIPARFRLKTCREREGCERPEAALSVGRDRSSKSKGPEQAPLALRTPMQKEAAPSRTPVLT